MTNTRKKSTKCQSKCTRCLAPIHLKDLKAFLECYYLCARCADVSDSEHAESIIESERPFHKLSFYGAMLGPGKLKGNGIR
jgi:hypothetical protein